MINSLTTLGFCSGIHLLLYWKALLRLIGDETLYSVIGGFHGVDVGPAVDVPV